jgi:hypothetical protein
MTEAIHERRGDRPLYEDPTATRRERAWFWSSPSWGRRGTGSGPTTGTDARGGKGAVCRKLGGLPGHPPTQPRLLLEIKIVQFLHGTEWNLEIFVRVTGN